MNAGIFMMLSLCIMATAMGLYFYIKDLKEKKKR